MTLLPKVLFTVVCAVAAATLSSEGLVAHDHVATGKTGSDAMHAVMGKGHKEMMQMKMTGDPDHDFAMMMVSHHKGAIDMSEIVLKHGHDPKIQAMARKIIDSQKKEIAEFEAWMKEHKPATAGHAH